MIEFRITDIENVFSLESGEYEVLLLCPKPPGLFRYKSYIIIREGFRIEIQKEDAKELLLLKSPMLKIREWVKGLVAVRYGKFTIVEDGEYSIQAFNPERLTTMQQTMILHRLIFPDAKPYERMLVRIRRKKYIG